MTKEKILIINTHHLGTLTDVYKWCYFLRDDYDVTLLCFDTGIEKPLMEGVAVKYINHNGSLKTRGVRYILRCLWNILWFRGKVLVVYFEHCDVLKRVFPFKKMILDIRTLSIDRNKEIRVKADNAIINACKHYDVVSVISEGVKQKIGNVAHPVFILPLGSDPISSTSKDYSSLKLIYVGTFNGRDLDKTIKGVALFCKKHPKIYLTYDIIGSGSNNELEDYKRLTDSLGLNSKVTFHGRIANNLLEPYFDKANIGVSFVPITEYYNAQPPTKTFEYVLSGLFCIATATDENRKLITCDNGILIQDTANDFAYALEVIFEKKELFNEERIRNSLKDSSWKNIVNEYLKPILEQIE